MESDCFQLLVCVQTLAKVICMVLRFNDEETKAVLEREASKS